MTSAFGRGTALQRTLGALLRRLRKEARLSGPVLAGRLDVSQSHLSRVELGDAAATRELVEGWLRETVARDTDQDTARGLAASVAAEFSSWREALASGLVKMQRESAEAEAAATVQLVYYPLLVPGLLQTADYARNVVLRKYPNRADVNAAVAARMQRQLILYSRAKTLRWVVGEAAFRWRMGSPEVMAAQLGRIATLAAEPHLDIRVLPFAGTAAVWNDHAFTIDADRIDGEPDLVHVELLTGPLNIRDPEQVRQYREAYERLAELSVAGDEAVRLILAIRAELTSTQ